MLHWPIVFRTQSKADYQAVSIGATNGIVEVGVWPLLCFLTRSWIQYQSKISTVSSDNGYYFKVYIRVLRLSLVWIVERMRYRPTNQPTNRPTDTASYRGALSHLKSPIWQRCLLTGEVNLALSKTHWGKMDERTDRQTTDMNIIYISNHVYK